MKSYTSFNTRRVPTIMGPCYNFVAGEPMMVQENTYAIVEAAGITTTEEYEALMNGKVAAAPQPTVAPAPEPEKPEVEEGTSYDELRAEMGVINQQKIDKALAYEEAQAVEQAEAEAEKSPAFDQVVFEAAVREVLESGNKADLTPKGMPKAKLISDLCGFEVKAGKVVQYCKSKD